MTNQHPPQSFLDKLHASVTMRPKWRFWLDHVTVGAALVMVAIGLVYIGSFVTYLWRSAKFSSLPAFGGEGYGVFARVFPWWHLVAILFGIAAFIFLVRRHTQLYRWPIVAILGVFLLAFTAAALLTDTTRLHDRLTNREIDGAHVPFIGGFYRGQAGLTQGVVTAATITKVSPRELTVTIADEKKIKVMISSSTRLSPSWNPQVGDKIVVIGKNDDGEIRALAIHDADELPDREPFRLRGDMMNPPPEAY